uniref:Uncharacterized protein n=1 Tax=Candidatus Kentrum sp. DK TaxID=2126562 RepID=A0A450SFD8_9GAMM|nr:MAG: hypothetical protein BECKDK2373B_GA0170837_103330 [Candidatus Kentron sp. DK]
MTVPCIEPCGKGEPGTGLFELEKLIAFKRQGMTKFPCMVSGCEQAHDIDALLSNAPPVRAVTVDTSLTALLNEFADVKRALVVIYQKMREGQAEVQAGQATAMEAFAQLDANDQQLLSRIDGVRDELLQALTDEAKDGPRLFTLEPVNRSRFNPKGWASEKFRITLWCEHSRLPLPVLYGDENKGVCKIELDRTWFRKAAPLLKVLNGTLRLGLPVAAAGLELTLDEAAYGAMEVHLDAGQELIEASMGFKGGGTEEIGGALEDDAPDRERGQAVGSPISAHGSVLREFHALLRKQDPGCKFGGLVRVRNKRNEFLWVHPRFEGEY